MTVEAQRIESAIDNLTDAVNCLTQATEDRIPTLHDFFAAQVLAAMPKETMACLSGDMEMQHDLDRKAWIKAYAEFCYEMADAMMDARAGEKEGG